MKNFFSWVINWLSASENRKSVFYIVIISIVLCIFSYNFYGRFLAYNENIINVLFLLTITYFLSDRLFTTPRNVVANAISVCILAASMYLKIVWIYSCIVLVVGILALLYKEEELKEKENTFKKIGRFSFKISKYLGNSKIIVSLLFFYTLRDYIDNGNNKIVITGALVLYWLILFLPDLMNEIFKFFYIKEPVKIGLVAYSNSPYNASVYLQSNSDIGVGDRIYFDTECNDCPKGCNVRYYGVLNNIWTDKDDFVNMGDITFFGIDANGSCSRGDFINPLGLKEIKRPIKQDVELYKYECEDGTLPILSDSNNILGYTYPGSELNRIKFFIYPHMEVKRGDFVTIKFFSSDEDKYKDIFYQVVNIRSFEDPNLNSVFGMNIAEANLIGSYESLKFNEFKSLPYNSFPVWRIDQQGDLKFYKDFNEHLGYLPATQLSVSFNINTATVYHTAILGTTGSGKTTLSKKLIKMLAKNGIKNIIFDVHGEYQFVDEQIIEVVEFEELDVVDSMIEFMKSDEYALLQKTIYANVEDELREYIEKRQIKNLIDINLIMDGLGTTQVDKKNKYILNEFQNEWYPKYVFSQFDLESFLRGNKKILLLNLKNLQIDLQRWIVADVAHNIYELYKQKETELVEIGGGKEPKARAALILEEAHIFVPETGEYDLGFNKEIKNKCYNYLVNIALRGRKYGLGLYVISQRSAFVKKGILSQCNTIFALKTINDNDKKVFYDFMNKDYVELLSGLEVPEAILVGKASSSSKPILIEVDNDNSIEKSYLEVAAIDDIDSR